MDSLSRILALSFFTLIAFNLNTFATDPHIAVGAKGYKQDCKDHTVVVIDAGFNTTEKALKHAFADLTYAAKSAEKSKIMDTINAKIKKSKFTFEYLRERCKVAAEMDALLPGYLRDYFEHFSKEAGITPYQLQRILYDHDDLSHGTHVAGIIAGKKIGLAKNCKIIPIDTISRTIDEALAEAISIAKKRKISAVNISLGFSESEEAMSQRLMDLVQELCSYAPVFKSAGNSATSYGDDAETNSLIQLAEKCQGRFILSGSLAYNPFGQERHSDFSELAGKAEEYYVAAPGSNIESCTGLGIIERMSGTSMASPMTVAVYVNLLTKLQKDYKDLVTDNDAIKVLLASTRQTSINDSTLFEGNKIGKGVIDLGHAIDVAPQVLNLDEDLADWNIVRQIKDVKPKGMFGFLKAAASYYNPWS